MALVTGPAASWLGEGTRALGVAVNGLAMTEVWVSLRQATWTHSWTCDRALQCRAPESRLAASIRYSTSQVSCPSLRLCSSHPTDSRYSFSSDSPSCSVPARMASMMSGARSLSRSTRAR